MTELVGHAATQCPQTMQELTSLTWIGSPPLACVSVSDGQTRAQREQRVQVSALIVISIFVIFLIV